MRHRMLPIMLLAFSVVASLLLFRNMEIAVVFLLASFLYLSVRPSEYIDVARKLLPFIAALFIAALTLLGTIQLVKTQLTEIAFISALIAGICWSFVVNDITAFMKQFETPRWAFIPSICFAITIGLIAFFPKLARQEHLLTEVRYVRQNTNAAIQWAAAHLEKNALFALSGYSLYGIGHGDALTAADDETKIRQQYTFVGGYVYVYLEQLGRRDIEHAYLDDSAVLPRVMSAMGERGNCYLFLQTKLDLDYFHGALNNRALLRASDSLVASFTSGPYPVEIWKLR